MPFQSKKQMRYLAMLAFNPKKARGKGKFSKAKFHEWAEETPDIKSLPMRKARIKALKKRG